MSNHKSGLKNSPENLRKILNFDNYEIYYLMDELAISHRRMWAFIEANNSRTDFWKELEKNDMISKLIAIKPAGERKDYYYSRRKLMRRAVQEERYEDAETLKNTVNYFRYCFMSDLISTSVR